jgi:transposase
MVKKNDNIKKNTRTADKKNKKSGKVEFSIVRSDAAGIDIGSKENYVALPPDRGQPVRSFGTFTPDLEKLADWLTEHGIATVAMESTGVYWIPLFQLLDSRGFEVFLVNARHAKALPGRKTDVKDCQWLQHLHSVGLLDASFRPEDAIVAIRTLSRHRDSLIKTASRCIQHMQKALTQMNIHLHHVISDISGETGLRILDAIINGEYDPVELIKLKSKRIKASDEVLVKSLRGDYRRELIFTLRQALQAYRNTRSLIHDCDNEISQLVSEFNDNQNTGLATNSEEPEPTKKTEAILHFEIKQAFGIDLTRLPGFGIATALQVFSEVGPAGFSKFRSDAAFASWLALCPNHEITGGQVKSSKTRDSKSRLRNALRQSASSLANEKGYFGSTYRRLRGKFGPVKAITALAHRLARLLFHLVTTGQEYDESIYALAEASHRKHQEVLLQRKAKAFGFSLTPA